MNIKDMVVVEGSFLYKILAEKFIWSVFVLGLILYIISYLLADYTWRSEGFFGQYLCEIKLDEYYKSNLVLDGQMRSYIYLSNLFLFIAPIVLTPFLFKEKFRDTSISVSEKWVILKLIVYMFILGVVFWLLSYVAPFTKVASMAIFANKITYILMNSLAAVGVLLMQYGIFCFSKFLIISR